MHIPTFSLAVFATLTTAQDFCTSNASTPGYCELLSFTDRTLNVTSPPSSSDCQDACRGVLGEAGDWSANLQAIFKTWSARRVASAWGARRASRWSMRS
ncbi:hypothetical protein SNOG_11842 [Parastagonospora nodorum SN15]|uniref:Uncharacterized protein n=1 Tax=Phaeosphaeria nodorum (strain SN15 / ATCC MYA-4574 / FGSC 10173) TaxID=321614 RepID=Q0U8S2_PHANO|nr:hypothetical protein SNOG_11842 [Parastagonospora nodorum SN15]EAT80886.1 hypothetical protein SNOG_11842 [Parastagonospora nodorum SN15]